MLLSTTTSDEVKGQGTPAAFSTVCGGAQLPGVVEWFEQRKRASGGYGGRGVGLGGGLGGGGFGGGFGGGGLGGGRNCWL